MPCPKRHRPHLYTAIQASQDAVDHGNAPFGAALVASAGNVLCVAENTVFTDRDPTAHAEINLIRKASQTYGRHILEHCTVYASTEPCPMCSAAIFWAGIRHIVFAVDEQSIYAKIPNAPKRHALPISCADVLSHSPHPIRVEGPFLPRKALSIHRAYWASKPSPPKP